MNMVYFKTELRSYLSMYEEHCAMVINLIMNTCGCIDIYSLTQEE